MNITYQVRCVAVVVSVLLAECNCRCRAQERLDTATSGISVATATAVSGLVAVVPQKSLRLLARPLSTGGLEVTWIDDDSPVKAMTEAQDASVTGSIEIGDLIVGVDGKPVNSNAELYRALRNGQQTVLLSVKDVRTDVIVEWRSSTAPITVPKLSDKPIAAGEVRIHCIYAALTSDGALGEMILRDVPRVNSFVKGLIGGERLATFTMLDGSKCTARGIRDAIDNLDVKPNDSVFFYYQGHGAYDEAHAEGDPAFGHHLQLPDEGLLRREILFRIAAKAPRFTLIATDCCNVESKLQEPGKAFAELRQVEITGWTTLEELLVCYRGVIDVTATSRREYAWYDNVTGGWFTDAFITQFYVKPEKDGSQWDSFLSRLTVNVDTEFQRRKKGVNIPALVDQKHMTPVAFTHNVTREEAPNKPTTPRVFSYPVYLVR